MKNQIVNCKEVMSHICENLGEELNSPKCLDIRAHLTKCKDCQNYFISVERTIELYKKYNVEISQEAEERLFKILNLEKRIL
ncbi:MAG: hypothetical protein C0425_01820 [Chlorobiaceae bacterium]|nr:hypothetical protein [Chlorobiaceae bacterium]MBA4309056.1 hypothetical protein [Chlorobiaceae bacterium]